MGRDPGIGNEAVIFAFLHNVLQGQFQENYFVFALCIGFRRRGVFKEQLLFLQSLCVTPKRFSTQSNLNFEITPSSLFTGRNPGIGIMKHIDYGADTIALSHKMLQG